MSYGDGEQPPVSETPEPKDDTNNPVFNLPPFLVGLLAALLLAYVLPAYFLSEDGTAWYIFTFGFIPLRYAMSFSQQGMEWLWTPVTYSFLHGGIEHILFNGLWLMAFGAPVLRRIGTLRFVLLWCISAAVSAFGHAALNWGDVTVLIGASGVVSALMGAARTLR